MKKNKIYYEHCKSVLYQSSLFNGLAENVLDDMLTMFRRDTWRRGTQLDEVIFQERFYLLINGRVEIMRVNSQSGRSITLYLLGPGDGIDVVTLLNNDPHDIQPIAIDDVDLISVPIKAAREWIDRHPEFNRNFLPYLGEQMRKLEDLSSELALYDTMTRLARLILRHVIPHHSESKKKEYSLKLIHDLHDESLAHMVGSVRQVVNRHLQHWRKQGVLHKQNFHTEVCELEILQQYAYDCHLSVTKKESSHKLT